MANYIVLDLEWNQPISKGKTYRTEKLNLYGEIIQIGAVKLNDDLEITDEISIFVKPEIYTKMNKEIKELTSITDEDIAGGLSFSAAVDRLLSWAGEQPIFLMWGESDEEMLIDNSILHNLNCDWIPEWFDAQLMFDDQITQEDRRYSLDYACYTLNITGSYAHDALHDARATAEVLKHLEVAEWIEEEREYLKETYA